VSLEARALKHYPGVSALLPFTATLQQGLSAASLVLHHIFVLHTLTLSATYLNCHISVLHALLPHFRFHKCIHAVRICFHVLADPCIATAACVCEWVCVGVFM